MAPQSGFRINPRVLVWARSSAGMTLETAASRARLRPEELASWEAGEGIPAIAPLQGLATIYRRPLAALLLSRVPETTPLPTDFRLLPLEEREPFSEAIHFAVREARRLARSWKELPAESRGEGRPSLGGATLSQDPEVVAERTRRALGIRLEDQRGWKDERTALRQWRNAVERTGILVFQFPLPVGQARGFSVREGAARAIVMNSHDAVSARIFTIFHELGHLMLGEDGICLLEEPTTRSQAAAVESYCNRFAAELLVPRASLTGHPVIAKGRTSGTYADSDLATIARDFKVSREVILGRLLNFRMIDRRTYEDRRSDWKRRGKPRKAGGKRDPPRDCYRRLGPRFVGTVLNAHHRGILTQSDVADYLGLRLKHLATLERIAAVEVP